MHESVSIIMPESVSEGIEQEFFQLLGEVKYIEARQVIRRIKKKQDLSNEDRLLILYLKGYLNFERGMIGNTLNIANKLYDESKKNKIHARTVDALNFKFMCGSAGRMVFSWDELWEFILEAEDMLKLIPKETQNVIEPRKALIDSFKGYYYYNRGDLNLAIDACKSSLKISKQIRISSYLIPGTLMQMGFIYSAKGELETALKVCSETLQIIKGRNVASYRGISANVYRCIGNIYYQQGKLDLAVENYEKVLETQWPGQVAIPWTCLSLVQLYLDKNSPKDAEVYLERLKEFYDQRHYPAVKLLFNLSRARILKSSKRIQNLAESEKILKQLIKQETFTLVFRIFIIVELCDLLLIELQITDDIEILDEIDAFISQLLKIAEKQHSYSALAQTYLLQAKISLISFKRKEARRLLIQAQRIAEKHGLNQLAHEIANIQEEVLQQLDIWDNLEETNAPISKRMELAHLSEDFGKSIRSRLNNMPQVSEISVSVYKEQKKCLVCRGNIEGFNNYICSKCDSVYCKKCARALIEIENACWSCESPIDKTKPVKSLKQEVEDVNIKKRKIKK